MTYRDTTFCPYHEDCLQGKDCPRALTAEVQADAERWWGNENAPISMFAEVPYCMEPKKGSVYEPLNFNGEDDDVVDGYSAAFWNMCEVLALAEDWLRMDHDNWTHYQRAKRELTQEFVHRRTQGE